MEQKSLIAVYGTLKKGFENHFIIKNSKFLGSYVTKTRHVMLDLGVPHCSVRWDIGMQIKVELYEVNEKTLERLDALEGHPHNYYRDWVELEGHESKKIQMYYSRVPERFSIEQLAEFDFISDYGSDEKIQPKLDWI